MRSRPAACPAPAPASDHPLPLHHHRPRKFPARSVFREPGPSPQFLLRGFPVLSRSSGAVQVQRRRGTSLDLLETRPVRERSRLSEMFVLKMTSQPLGFGQRSGTDSQTEPRLSPEETGDRESDSGLQSPEAALQLGPELHGHQRNCDLDVQFGERSLPVLVNRCCKNLQHR